MNDPTFDLYSADPSTYAPYRGKRYVDLDCTTETNGAGVTLSSTPKTFYIAIPPRTRFYAQNLVIEVYNTTNTVPIKTFTSVAESGVLYRNNIYNLNFSL